MGKEKEYMKWPNFLKFLKRQPKLDWTGKSVDPDKFPMIDFLMRELMDDDFQRALPPIMVSSHTILPRATVLPGKVMKRIVPAWVVDGIAFPNGYPKIINGIKVLANITPNPLVEDMEYLKIKGA